MVKRIGILAVMALALSGIFSHGESKAKGTKMAVIFDFDGTIANTMALAFQCWNNVADDAGYRKITDEDIKSFRELGILDFMHKIGVSTLQLPLLSKRTMTELRKNIDKMEPITNMPETLKALKAQGVTLGIVTSNSVEIVKAFLERHDMSNLFEFVYSEESIFSKFRAFFSKHVIIERCIKEHNLNPDISFYVGDETRDVEAAKKAGIKIISVPWGFNSKELLEGCNPDYLAATPMDISKIVNNEVSNKPPLEVSL